MKALESSLGVTLPPLVPKEKDPGRMPPFGFKGSLKGSLKDAIRLRVELTVED